MAWSMIQLFQLGICCLESCINRATFPFFTKGVMAYCSRFCIFRAENLVFVSFPDEKNGREKYCGF